MEGDWEQLELDFILPDNCINKQLSIYVLSTANSPAFFDDISISLMPEKRKDRFEKQSKFVDQRDGSQYSTVKLGNTWWMAESLNYPKDDSSLCYAQNRNLGFEYGKLYDYNTACMVCPEGWELPSDADWIELEKYQGMQDSELFRFGQRGNKEGLMLRPFGESGLNCKLGGANIKGYYNLNLVGYFWTSTKINDSLVICRELNNHVDIGRYQDVPEMRFSVRCIRRML